MLGLKAEELATIDGEVEELTEDEEEEAQRERLKIRWAALEKVVGAQGTTVIVPSLRQWLDEGCAIRFEAADFAVAFAAEFPAASLSIEELAAHDDKFLQEIHLALEGLAEAPLVMLAIEQCLDNGQLPERLQECRTLQNLPLDDRCMLDALRKSWSPVVLDCMLVCS